MSITRNNYDQSSTGINVELVANYDTDRSQWEWRENFHAYSYSGINSTCRAWYSDYSQLEAPDTVADCIDWQAATADDARGWLEDRYCTGEYAESVEAIEQAVADSYGGDWLDMARDCINGGYPLGWDDGLDIGQAIADDFEELGGYFTVKYNVAKIRGYCQGDYAEVLYDPAIWSVDFDPRDYFHNLFYDCPVYARVDIDGVEYYLDQELNDPYTWDRDEAEKIVRSWDIEESVADQVVAMLPDTLDYR